MKTFQKLMVVLTVMLLVAGFTCCLAACSLFTGTYEPVSYGNKDGSECYYVVYPGEVATLKQHHKCKNGAKAVPGPVFYVARYYPYLSGAFYRDTYVPTSARTAYDGYMASFKSAHAADIKANAPKAQYVDENGNVSSGSNIGVTDDGTHISSTDNSFGDTGSEIGTDPHSGTIGDPHGTDSGGTHGGVPDDHPVIPVEK